MVSESLGPPVEEVVAAFTDADESQVVHTGCQNFVFRRAPAVVDHRFEHVGGQDDAVVSSQGGCVVQSSEDLDIGIDVGHRAGMASTQKVEQLRLDGSGQLHQFVDEGHLLPYRRIDRQVLGPDHHERLGVIVDGALDVVEDEQLERSLRVVSSPTRGQHPGLGQVVASHD